jgi:hypothetical protein
MTEFKEIYEGLAELLNAEIHRGGAITASNPTIWSALHAIDDRLWHSVFVAYLEDKDYQPGWSSTRDLLEHLKKYGELYSPWTITPLPGVVAREGRPKEHQCKGTLWRWLMLTRERYCELNRIDLPNADHSKGKLVTGADQIFDWGTK